VPAAELVRRGLREQIADRLRDDIFSGRLAEGERLSEPGLVKRFGVSRAPIREALVKLTEEGLLIAKPNCGVKVAPPTPDAIQELVLPIRRTIETYALKHFFDSINDDDFRNWEEILQRLKRACQKRDFVACAEQDIAFHRSILERAGLGDLLAIWATLVARLRNYFRENYKKYTNKPIGLYEEHRAIVDIFRTGNKDRAVKALEDNIE
jgi:DNA-binding GntR family transcriptional regulator